MLEIYPTFLWLKTFIFLLPSPLSLTIYLSIYLFSYIAKGKVNLQLNRVS